MYSDLGATIAHCASLYPSSTVDAVWMGRAWSTTLDQLFAAGFPQVRWFDAEHPADTQVEKEVAETLRTQSYPSYGLAWPPQVSERLLTHWFGLEGGLTVEVLPDVVTKLLRGGGRDAFRGHEELVYLLEARFGPVPVLEAIVGALDVEMELQRRFANSGWGVAVALHSLFARVAPSIRTAGNQRLVGALERETTPWLKAVLKALTGGTADVVQNGHRAGGDLNPWMGVLMDPGAPELEALAGRQNKEGQFHARFAYLGDPGQIMPKLLPKLKSVRGAADRLFFAQSVGSIAHPVAVDVVLEAWEKRAARAGLSGWFRLGGDGFRAQLAGRSADSRAAELLKALG